MTSSANGNSAVTGEGTGRKWQRFSTRRGVPQAEAPAHARHLRRPGPPRPPRYSRQVVLKALGARIRQLRVRKGWSQEALAARSGLHRESIGEIERGENNARLSTLAAIKPHLKITMSELFKGIG